MNAKKNINKITAKIKFHCKNKLESNTEKRFYELLEAMPDKNEFVLISINSTKPQSLQQLQCLTKKGIQTLCVDFQRKKVLAMQQSFNSGKKCNFGHQNWFLFRAKRFSPKIFVDVVMVGFLRSDVPLFFQRLVLIIFKVWKFFNL